MDHDAPGKRSIWDDPILLGIIFGGAIIGIWAIWHFGHDWIVKVYWNFRAIELWILYATGGIADLPGLSAVRQWLDANCAPGGGVALCRREDWSDVTWGELVQSSFIINAVCAVILVILCVRAYRYASARHPVLRFAPRKAHTLKSFLAENAALYPHLRMFNRLNMTDAPIDDPMFGMSQTSHQYVFANRLIAGWTEETEGAWTPTLDRERAMRVFRTQLGRLWTPRPSGLSPGETLLLAITIPRVTATDAAMDDTAFQEAMKDSENVIQWCWERFTPPAKSKADDLSWLHPDIDLGYPQTIIRKYFQHPLVQASIGRHAYVRTVLYAMFCEARRLGVLPPAEMRWLRFFDRELWYVLQNISSRTAAFAEGAAVVSHYLYEAKSGGAIFEPQIDRAIDALKTGMTAFRYDRADKERYEAFVNTDS